jgi:hypothetical protein
MRSLIPVSPNPVWPVVLVTANHRDLDFGRAGMFRAVGQRFLHNAIHAGPMGIGQTFEVAFHREIDRHIVTAREVAGLPR